MLLLALGCAIALAVIWLGYPLMIAALAALKGERRRAGGDVAQRVSVVITTRDPETVIRARVADVLAGEYPPELLEVVVAVDHLGEVQAASLLELGEGVRVVAGPPPGGKAATLNAGVAASTGEILVFTDAAQRFDRHAIPRLVAALGDERLGAVSGALHIGRDGRPRTLAERYWMFERWLRLKEARVHSAVGVTGAIYAMRRSCWHPLPSGLILDDLYGPMQLVLRGFHVGFEPSAQAYDDRRFAPAQEFRRKARTLTGVVQLCAWLPDVLVPWRNPIWIQFVFHKLLRLATPYLALVAAAMALAWSETRLASAAPQAAFILPAVALLGGATILAASPRLRGAVVMAAAMQAAVVRATINGLRGRWDVWGR
ncbi:MAG: glycosyltransferase [Gemmatimonadota bacterium]